MTVAEADYIEQRLEAQIEWYDGKAATNQAAYKRLRLIEIVAAAMIPLLAGYSDRHEFVGMAIGGLGLIVAVLAGIMGLFRFQENWGAYRNTAEALKREKFLYGAKAAPYDGEDPFETLVARVEALLSVETQGWSKAMLEQTEKDQNQRQAAQKPAK